MASDQNPGPGPAEPVKGVGEHGDLPHPPEPDRETSHGHADVDESSDESFPASDPPAYTHSHAGPPKHDR